MGLPPLPPAMADQKVRGPSSSNGGGKGSGLESRKRGLPMAGCMSEIRPREAVVVGIHEDSSNVFGKYSGDKSKGHHALRSPGMRSPSHASENVRWMSARGRALIFVLIITLFFVLEAMMQGSIAMRMRGMDTSSTGAGGGFFPSARVSKTVPSLPQEIVKFFPQNIVNRLLLSRAQIKTAEQSRSVTRSPLLAVVLPNLGISPQSLYILTVTKGLLSLGYKIEVLAMKEGDLRFTFENMGVIVSHIHVDPLHDATVDWLNYEAVIAVSLNAKVALTSLARTPFRTVPAIWVIMTDTLAAGLGVYESNNATSLLYDWSRSFKRADVVVFPNYVLPLVYTLLDVGNFYVIPGSPVELWDAKVYMATHDRASLRILSNLGKEQFVISVVGSPFLHHNEWREHAFLMRALANVISQPSGDAHNFHLFVLGHSNSSNHYADALQAMAEHLGLSTDAVEYIGTDRDIQGVLWISDVVVYASYLNEQAFPPSLVRAMSLQRPVIAPEQATFKEYIKDGVNGLLYSMGDYLELSKALMKVKSSEGNLFIPSVGETTAAHNFLALNVTLSYGNLLENLISFPPNVMKPRPLEEVSAFSDKGWCWDLMSPLRATEGEVIANQVKSSSEADEDLEGSGIVHILEAQWMERMLATKNGLDRAKALNSAEEGEIIVDVPREQARLQEEEDDVVHIEQEELVERNEPREETWEEVTKNLRKTEVHRERLREQDDGDLERTGQPLCIYEPYYGAGSWGFLHEGNTLYRGLSLSTVGKRPGDDDVDAQVRLPVLLNETYYRNLLCDYGAVLAIGNRIDRIHKNAWIGFQPWRAVSKNMALMPDAEAALSAAVQTGRGGDALYFWAYNDISNVGGDTKQNDFWAMCDLLNYGNCREAYLKALKHMYGLPDDWKKLPPMPSDGSPWSAMHCWTLPTSSFVELVLFSRIFVDALDSQFYREHHDLGRCIMAQSRDRESHCYCQLLEGLVNVWAYHSARRMIYVDPQSGTMKEVHNLESRRSKMWVSWFSKETLKSMDDDLAEAMVDGDVANDHWLWPMTGEVFWRGIIELEREERWKARGEKQRLNRERIQRMRERQKFKAIGKFVKPKAEESLPLKNQINLTAI